MKGGGSNTSVICGINGLSPPVRKEKGPQKQQAVTHVGI